jgi:SRSO17 transposase
LEGPEETPVARRDKRPFGVELLLDACKAVPNDLEECLNQLNEFVGPYVALLPRKELRSHGEDFIRGLLSDLDRKSTEPIALLAGKCRRGMQRFIGECTWEHEPLIGLLRRQVNEALGSAAGVITVDSTGLIKKGHASVGVARQYCGRTGQVENCQIGVFLGYSSSAGHTLIDERLFLPKTWVKDKARREMCHVPKRLRYKTQCTLALEMIEECRGQIAHGWIAADGDFGHSAPLRAKLRELGERYVVDTHSKTRIKEAECTGILRSLGKRAASLTTAVKWKDTVPERDWVRVFVRNGSKGPVHLWATRARVRTNRDRLLDKAVEWLLVMRTEDEVPEHRYCLSNAEVTTPIEEMVRAASARFWIEDCFERAKGIVGLTHNEARTWQGWHHHVTLVMLALWFLVQEQKRLRDGTPAITVQQSAEAIEELLRNPATDLRRLAKRITNTLQRTEEARISHWRRRGALPPTWEEMRLTKAAQ